MEQLATLCLRAERRELITQWRVELDCDGDVALALSFEIARIEREWRRRLRSASSTTRTR